VRCCYGFICVPGVLSLTGRRDSLLDNKFCMPSTLIWVIFLGWMAVFASQGIVIPGDWIINASRIGDEGIAPFTMNEIITSAGSLFRVFGRGARRAGHLVRIGAALPARRVIYPLFVAVCPLYLAGNLDYGGRTDFLYEIEIILTLAVGGKMI